MIGPPDLILVGVDPELINLHRAAVLNTQIWKKATPLARERVWILTKRKVTGALLLRRGDLVRILHDSIVARDSWRVVCGIGTHSQPSTSVVSG